MGDTFLILIKCLLKIMFIVMIGYAARRLEIITDSGVRELSKMILKVFMPLNILASANRTLNKDSVTIMGITLGVSFCYYAGALLISYLLFKRIPMDSRKRGVAVTSSVFQNTGFVGYPVCESLYGAAGLGLAVSFGVFYDIFMYTIGLRIMTGDSKGKFSLKQFFTPIICAIFISNAVFLSGHRWPDLLQSTFQIVGSATTPASLIVIGAGLVGMDFKSVFTSGVSYLVVLMRNLVLPLIVMLAVRQIPALTQQARAICVIMSAVPVGSLNVILCRDNGGDYEFANKGLLLSMLASLITMPLLITLAMR